MIELILYYIFPNVFLFGGLFLLGKAIEDLTWKGILWYTKNM
jgi:hypothetical protein